MHNVRAMHGTGARILPCRGGKPSRQPPRVVARAQGLARCITGRILGDAGPITRVGGGAAPVWRCRPPRKKRGTSLEAAAIRSPSRLQYQFDERSTALAHAKEPAR